MFGSTPKDNPSPETKEESVIARGLSLTGELCGNGTVRLDGEFDGKIACSQLVIGKEGHLKGQVHAETVLVQGRLDGEVQAQTVTLTRTATVTGNVYHKVLEVEAGATVEGRYSQSMPETSRTGAKLVAHSKGKQPATSGGNRLTPVEDNAPASSQPGKAASGNLTAVE